MTLFFKRVLIGVGLVFVSACQSGVKNVADPLMAKLLFQGQQCGHQQSFAAVTRIADEQALTALAQQTGKIFSFTDKIDFEQQLLLLVEMGMKPTTGYRLSLSDNEVEVDQHKAVLILNWQQPPADAFLAQVLTSPCLLVSIPFADYASVELVDNDGKPRLLLKNIRP